MGTRIEGNIVHELGMWEKQSSMWFQAKSAKTTIRHNLFFNGPRAGINFNDGFGGGDEVSENLIFNTCRESGDHGPINSWDRQPYLTTVRTGSPSLVPVPRDIHHNFIVANYDGTKGIDNDDGSSYYQMHHNFHVGGWMHKSNFGGHSKDTYGSIGIDVTLGMRMTQAQFPEYRDSFVNNTVVLKSGSGRYYVEVANDVATDAPSCEQEQCYQHVGGNRVFADGNPPSVLIRKNNDRRGTTIAFEEWIAMGYDKNTTFTGSVPSTDEIVSWVRSLLAMKPGAPAGGALFI